MRRMAAWARFCFVFVGGMAAFAAAAVAATKSSAWRGAGRAVFSNSPLAETPGTPSRQGPESNTQSSRRSGSTATATSTPRPRTVVGRGTVAARSTGRRPPLQAIVSRTKSRARTGATHRVRARRGRTRRRLSRRGGIPRGTYNVYVASLSVANVDVSTSGGQGAQKWALNEGAPHRGGRSRMDRSGRVPRQRRHLLPRTSLTCGTAILRNGFFSLPRPCHNSASGDPQPSDRQKASIRRPAHITPVRSAISAADLLAASTTTADRTTSQIRHGPRTAVYQPYSADHGSRRKSRAAPRLPERYKRGTTSAFSSPTAATPHRLSDYIRAPGNDAQYTSRS